MPENELDADMSSQKSTTQYQQCMHSTPTTMLPRSGSSKL
jgi:hypothetical protein